MANVILFTDRAPTEETTHGLTFNLERYGRPAGAYKVASTLRKNGYSVLVVPNCLRLSFKGVKTFISNNSSDLIYVGMSTTFTSGKLSNIEEYRKLWRSTDKDTLDISEIFGKLQKDTNSADNFTSLLWSEGELSLLSEWLTDTYSAKLVLGGSWVSSVKDGAMNKERAGVYLIEGQNEDYIVEFSNAIRDQKEIPLPFGKKGEKDFKSSFIDYTPADFVSSDEWLPIEIARGCAFKCAYCQYEHKGKDDTTKHSKSLRDELIRNYEKHGVTKYLLLDDLYNDSEEKVKRLYDEVWSKLPFTPEWISYLRLDMIWHRPETAQYLEASGCKLGAFGIETMHTKAGKKVGKGLGKERIIETLEHLKETWNNRVLVSSFFIAGLPWEPYDHIVETMDWLKKTDLVFNYTYFPLYVTPPEHIKLQLVSNDISKDNEKYDIRWGNEGWINNVGVTFNQINALIKQDDLKRQQTGIYSVDLIEYPELRSHGYTHKQISDKSFHPQIINDVKSGRYRIPQLIDEKFQKIIALTGQ